MANQTYDLTQTGQEVQNIINDANGAKNAAAQTTLTTDYVMLKDTSGNYHKIDKSSFTEAIRDTLATLLTNNDKGTTFNLVPAIASGDFGSVTPENLASVLGEAAISYETQTNCNNLPPYKWYVLNNDSISNGINTESELWYYYTLNVNSGGIMQIGIKRTNDTSIFNIYIRQFVGNIWSTWIKMI